MKGNEAASKSSVDHSVVMATGGAPPSPHPVPRRQKKKRRTTTNNVRKPPDQRPRPAPATADTTNNQKKEIISQQSLGFIRVCSAPTTRNQARDLEPGLYRVVYRVFLFFWSVVYQVFLLDQAQPIKRNPNRRTPFRAQSKIMAGSADIIKFSHFSLFGLVRVGKVFCFQLDAMWISLFPGRY